jgi:hypothetical protein
VAIPDASAEGAGVVPVGPLDVGVGAPVVDEVGKQRVGGV